MNLSLPMHDWELGDPGYLGAGPDLMPGCGRSTVVECEFYPTTSFWHLIAFFHNCSLGEVSN